MKIGEARRVKWYVLEDENVVSFHTATLDKEGAKYTFFSDHKQFPSATIAQLGISHYEFMTNASDKEVEKYLIENPRTIVQRVVETLP